MTHENDMLATARSQEAWGKFNTAPAWSRHYAATALMAGVAITLAPLFQVALALLTRE